MLPCVLLYISVFCILVCVAEGIVRVAFEGAPVISRVAETLDHDDEEPGLYRDGTSNRNHYCYGHHTSTN